MKLCVNVFDTKGVMTDDFGSMFAQARPPFGPKLSVNISVIYIVYIFILPQNKGNLVLRKYS